MGRDKGEEREIDKGRRKDKGGYGRSGCGKGKMRRKEEWERVDYKGG